MLLTWVLHPSCYIVSLMQCYNQTWEPQQVLQKKTETLQVIAVVGQGIALEMASLLLLGVFN